MKVNFLVCLLDKQIGFIDHMFNKEIRKEYLHLLEELKRFRKFIIPFHIFESLLNPSIEDFRKVSRDYFYLVEYLEKYKIYQRFKRYIYHSYESSAESKSDMQEMFFDLNEHMENRFHDVNMHDGKRKVF